MSFDLGYFSNWRTKRFQGNNDLNPLNLLSCLKYVFSCPSFSV